jgi:hypothetical protein
LLGRLRVDIKVGDSVKGSWLEESEVRASSPRLGRLVSAGTFLAVSRRKGFKAIRRTAGDSEKGSWLKESEVRASSPGRTILGIEQQTGSMRF